MTADWYRNTTWNEAVEHAFDVKLHRSRKKEQYLRIQASMLTLSHPGVALKLLERYFELVDDFDHAQAYVDRAKALLALGRVDEALSAYEDALSRESVFPKLKTQAYLDLPYLVATHGVEAQYERALELLHLHKSRMMFPVDHFRWHAAHALISSAVDDGKTARDHAARALAAANQEHSGFRFHPWVGIVTTQYWVVIRKLEALSSASNDHSAENP